MKDVTHMMQIVSQWYEVRRQSYMEQWKEMDVVEWGVCLTGVEEGNESGKG